MPQKKENLPVKVDVDLQNGGTITYANEVIATIAGVAANEVDGIAGMCISGGFSEILSRNRNITRGVKVEVGGQEAAIDLYIIVEYGKPIQRVATDVQENVRKALESLTGLHVVRVDVHVQGVSFEKEKKAAQTSIEAAQQPVLTESAAAEQTDAAEAAAQEAPAEEVQIPAEEKEETASDSQAAEEAAPESNAEACEAPCQCSEECTGHEDVPCCDCQDECAAEHQEEAPCQCSEECHQEAPAEEAAPAEAPVEEPPVVEEVAQEAPKKPARRPSGRKRS